MPRAKDLEPLPPSLPRLLGVRLHCVDKVGLAGLVEAAGGVDEGVEVEDDEVGGGADGGDGVDEGRGGEEGIDTPERLWGWFVSGVLVRGGESVLVGHMDGNDMVSCRMVTKQLEPVTKRIRDESQAYRAE